MTELITVVGNAPFPDIPLGRAVSVPRTPRIDGLLASGRISRVEPEGVPYTVEDVKAWVGDDPDRAGRALEVEQFRPSGPRTTLEPWLQNVIAPPAAPTGADDDVTDPEPDHTRDDPAALTGDPEASD